MVHLEKAKCYLKCRISYCLKIKMKWSSFSANWAITKKQQGGKKVNFFFFFRKQKNLFFFTKGWVPLFFEITVMFRLREEYKYQKEMQTLQLQTRLVPFFIIMISAGVTGFALFHSSQLPSHKYVTFSWLLLQLHWPLSQLKAFFN